MLTQNIDPEVWSRLTHSLEKLSPEACFVRCQLSSLTKLTLRCTIPLSERIVRFMVPASSVRDDQGGLLSAEKPVHFGTKGWVEAEVAGISNGPGHRQIVRIRQVEGDCLEVEMEGSDVVSLVGRK